MNASDWIDFTLAWIQAHPLLAGLAVFAIACSDAVIILGAIVPALPLLIAVGVLIGMGQLNGPYALACTALGAFAGDGLSYWVGRRWGQRLFTVWPFQRYPQLLIRGQTLFSRNAFKSILVARYVGAIRPFVPAVAGMAQMPLLRYCQASGLACLSWAALFLLPGWMLGQAYEAVAAVAGRLFWVLTALAGVLALVWALMLYGYRWSAVHLDHWIKRLLHWSHRYPRLGRYWRELFDPQRREAVPLAVLAALWLLMGWGSFALIIAVGGGGPLALDLMVHRTMLALRNPLADVPMVALASLGDWQVLLPAFIAGMSYLLWRQRYMAAIHWLLALVLGLALSVLIGSTVTVARPPLASAGFEFPSLSITAGTIIFGFFALLIGRELPGRNRVWPYLISGIVVMIIGFARIYLGAHWLSDVIGGMLFGTFWLLLLGAAYRHRSNRSFWVKPLTLLFYGSFVLSACWYAPRDLESKLANFEPAQEAARAMEAQHWWAEGWRELPMQRNELDDDQRWILDIQVAGSLTHLQQRLEQQGWRSQKQAGWQQALTSLDKQATAQQMPVLPATLGTRNEALLMLYPGVHDNEMYALRLWPTALYLMPGEMPLWHGSIQTLGYRRYLDLFGLWRPSHADNPALERLKQSLDAKDFRQVQQPDTDLPLLLIDSTDQDQ